MAGKSKESGFEIDGERYEIPTLASVTLDEERLLYIYADCIVNDFVDPHPDWSEETTEAHLLLRSTKFRNPDFKRALVHIAYRRRHPELDDDAINELVGRANALELDLALLRGASEVEDPPRSSPNELEKTSEQSTLGRNMDSGRPTLRSSDPPDSSPGNIGISESDTSSPESLPIASGS